jgi:hypothetical protein
MLLSGRQQNQSQLARMEFAVSHSKQTTAHRINRQLPPAPSTPFFHSLCAGLIANEILERTVTRSKQTTDPSTRRETNSLLFAALPDEPLLTNQQSHLLRHLRSNFSIYPLLHFAIVIALLAFLPWGSTRQRPRATHGKREPSPIPSQKRGFCAHSDAD